MLFGVTQHAASGGIVYNMSNGFQFRTNHNVNRMVIDSEGSVGINTTIPQATLDVIRAPGALNAARFVGSSYSSQFHVSTSEHTYIRGGKANSNVTINDQTGGKVGIRREPSANFDILGGNNWDLTNTEGDMRIGNDSYRLKFGVALGGGGAGAAGIMQYGQTGFNALSLGAQGKYFLQIDGNQNAVNLTNISGGLRINGNAGASGQSLMSTGAGTPEWRSPTKTMYDLTTMKLMSADLTLTDASPRTELPGLSHTFSTTQKTRIVVSYNLNALALACTFCGESSLWIDIELNGARVSRIRESLNNGERDTPDGTYLITVGPGTYTIRITADVSGPDVSIQSGGFLQGRMILHMIPE